MPVTDPLSSRRTGGSKLARRRAAATKVATVSAVVTASLAILAGADQHMDDTGRLDAGKSVDLSTETQAAQAVAFTLPELPQLPQLAPGTLPWEPHKPAIENRPRTVRPVAGALTSNFGTRWGAMHAGLDFGDALGAPIVAVTDGVIIEAGPASGFGMWVRVQQDDGTVGVYGHVNDILAHVGQQVQAGDLIATVGNRGYSTGPHLHYEVHHPEIGPIDPAPWLAERGVPVESIGGE
ncbi:M23 family metallopeptidase [Nocardia goodfellowii]|uniref:Murein DD-endopeptidase MepM/ murein hydrolase activator NlpD n=1 Tax=Nocardia goodfellowii TaxID=882446 RepID=A0ABS4QHB2_9NOCA|nr:M23 family metallopeptidase [Nocardia goodfellowii]MBP2191089.1 murein DD-endopeptidase MepM/ murein hydrolase activator NlpD [Nocardia goodfellowii]